MFLLVPWEGIQIVHWKPTQATEKNLSCMGLPDMGVATVLWPPYSWTLWTGPFSYPPYNNNNWLWWCPLFLHRWHPWHSCNFHRNCCYCLWFNRTCWWLCWGWWWCQHCHPPQQSKQLGDHQSLLPPPPPRTSPIPPQSSCALLLQFSQLKGKVNCST